MNGHTAAFVENRAAKCSAAAAGAEPAIDSISTKWAAMTRARSGDTIPPAAAATKISNRIVTVLLTGLLIVDVEMMRLIEPPRYLDNQTLRGVESLILR